jgi:hypothetical protein
MFRLSYFNKCLFPIVFLLSFILPITKISSAQSTTNLSGIWLGAGYACRGPVKEPEIIDIVHKSDVVTATKIVGDDCIKSGELTWRGVFSRSPFRIDMNVTSYSNLRSRFFVKGTAEVVDNDIINLSVPGTEDGTLKFRRVGGSEIKPCNDSEVQAQYDRNHPRYHRYHLINAICSTSEAGCNKSAVFKVMLRNTQFIAPTSDISIVTNCKLSAVSIPVPLSGTDTVRTSVNSALYSITNYTKPDHIFHPGRVTRTIIERDRKLFIVSFGEGTGIFPKSNEFFASGTWFTTGFNDVDKKLIQAVRKTLPTR